MSGPSTSSERSTVNTAPHLTGHHDVANRGLVRQPDYQNEAATAAAAVSASYVNGAHMDEVNQFHQHQQAYNPASAAAAAAAAAQLQHQQQQQFQQQHLQQQHHLHQQQLHQFQQHQQQLQQQHHQRLQQQMQQAVASGDYETGPILHSKFMENEIIKTFPSKAELVKYVKTVLNDEEQCKIVINSSKPKAVYFQCERSGSFRTTVKDSTKRQRVAYTKRNKCGYRLVANLYPPEKDKKRLKKSVTPEASALDRNLDDKLNEFQHTDALDNQASNGSLSSSSGEMWILRMINPAHNHPPEPPSGKKKRSKYSRTLVEKPLNRRDNNANDFVPTDIVTQLPPHHAHHHLAQHPHHQLQHLHHPEDPDHHPASVQDVSVIAAMDPSPAAAAAAVALHGHNPPVDPNIDPNVDPSVQEHDHAHGSLR